MPFAPCLPVYMTLAEPSGLMPMETVTPPPVTSKVLSLIFFSLASLPLM